nr:4Fe-4S dicluster domain-containing protein [Anaerolineae bacterium]
MASERQSPGESIVISHELARRVQEELGQNVYLCYQCIKCTAGCPVAEYFDWQPNQIMRALQLGQEDIALKAKTPWLCASCQTCTTRCPQGLDIAGIMDFLTQESVARGYKPPVKEVNIFNQAFLREVSLWRRNYEAGLMAELKLRTMNIMADLDLALRMFQRNKIPIMPAPTRKPRHVKPVAGASRSVAYYPGCSLHGTAAEYNTSTVSVCEALDLNLIEPDGWGCCGSSAAHKMDPEAAFRLPFDNLVLIEQGGFSEVTMPCAACYSRHKFAVHDLNEHRQVVDDVAKETGYTYQDRVHVSTLIEAIHQHVGLKKITKKVQQPLNSLKLVTYYGCLLTRPSEVTGALHPENPTDMDDLLCAAGAEVLDWSYKTCCCGAAHSLTRTDIVLDLSGNLLKRAREVGADAIAVACPLCHMNLDARQFQMKLDFEMPVLYFTQLLAIALGLPEKSAALSKNLVNPVPLLKSKGLLSEH